MKKSIKLLSFLLVILLAISFVFFFISSLHSARSVDCTAQTCEAKLEVLKTEILLKKSRNFGVHIYHKSLNKIASIYYQIKYFLLDLFFLDKKNVVNENKNFIKPIANDNYVSRFIAHAGGRIERYIYTNSLEALEKNYDIGFRLFELDIHKTKDNIYVAVHDWNEWKAHTDYEGELPPAYNDFKKFKIYNKFTSMDLHDINVWFCNHKDAILISDKVNDPVDFSKKFIDKNRLIMELFTWKAINEGINAGVHVMPTWAVLKTLGSNIVLSLKRQNIKFIAASRWVLKENKNILKSLLKNNIRVYAFNINYDKGVDEKYFVCNELKYFYGLYADKWSFNEGLQCE